MSEGRERWADAALAAAALAVDPAALGGVCLRARVGPVRAAWLDLLRASLPPEMPWRRLPPDIADDRLLGGLDLAATLASGRPVARAGLLAEAAGGIVVLPMAERTAPALTGRLALALDGASFALVALDEGAEPDERLPRALADRLAFHLDLEGIAQGDIAPGDTTAPVADIGAARRLLRSVNLPGGAPEALARAAAALGIGSLRAPILAGRVARALAALAGRQEAEEGDLTLAARLVLAPRATRLPPPEEQEQDDEAPPPPPPESGEENPAPAGDRPMEDVVLEAVRAVLPADLLPQIGDAGRGPRATQGGSGAKQKTPLRGRPAGTRARARGDAGRLDLVASLTAAAPWQAVRRRERPGREGVIVLPEDLRAKRFVRPAESVLIFLVDASGSAAAARLAEAKGAVELLLARAYARREKVALIAFRRDRAELLLPPTRSLARAKRQLAGLPGGGGTPLAAGLAAGLALAAQARRSGATPALALLTDGRANIALDGAPGREQAAEDASRMARLIRSEGYAAVLVDTAQRPQASAAALAGEMGASYLPLPRADAASFSRAIRAAVAP